MSRFGGAVLVAAMLAVPGTLRAATVFSPGADPDLDAHMMKQTRLFHQVHAAPFGIGIDSGAPDEETIQLLRDFLAQSDELDLETWAGRHPFEIVGGFSGPAGIGLRGAGAAWATAYRYIAYKTEGVTGTRLEMARRAVERAMDAVHVVVAITGEPGRVARGITRLLPEDEDDPPIPGNPFHEPTPLFDEEGNPLPPEKNNGTRRADNSGGVLPEGHWQWEDSCSRDQLVGWITAMVVLFDAAKGDPDIDQALVERMEVDARAISAMLREKREFLAIGGGPEEFDLVIMDADGRPTLHHGLNPKALEGQWFSNESDFENIFYMVMAWGIVKGLHHIGGDEETEAFLYDDLLGERGWIEALQSAAGVEYIYAGTSTNFSNVNMIVLSLALAITLETDETALAALRRYMEERWWSVEGSRWGARHSKQPFYHALYLLMTSKGSSEELAGEAAELLKGWTLGPYLGTGRENCDEAELAAGVCVAVDGVTELTIADTPGRGGHPVATEALDPRIRPPSNFDARSDPYRVNGGAGDTNLLPGGDLVSAYWILRNLEARPEGEGFVSPNARTRRGEATTPVTPDGEDVATDAGSIDSSPSAPDTTDVATSADARSAASDPGGRDAEEGGGSCSAGAPARDAAWLLAALVALSWALRRRRNALALCLAALLVPGVAEAQDAPPPDAPTTTRQVIAPVMTKTVEAILSIKGAAGAGKWRLKGAKIEKDRVVATFVGGGSATVVLLEHPAQSGGPAETVGPFAVRAKKGKLPAGIKAGLAAKVASAGAGFKWTLATARVERPATPAPAGGAAAQGSPAADAGTAVPPTPPSPYPLKKEDHATMKKVEAVFAKAWEGEGPDLVASVKPFVDQADIHPDVLFRAAVNILDYRGRDAAAPLFERVIERVSEMEKTSEQNPPAHILVVVGGSQLALGNTADGLKSLDAAIAADKESEAKPDPCRVTHGLHAAIGAGDVAALQKWLDGFAVANPTCVLARDIQARDLLARKKLEEGIALLKKHASAEGAPAELMERLADLYREAKRSDDAVATYRDLCARLPKECDARVRGNLVWAQSEYHTDPNRVEAATKRADERESDPLAAFEVGVMLHYAQRYEPSNKYLERARKTWADDPRILLYRAMNYYRGGKQAEAKEAIEHAVKTASARDPDLYYCRSVIYRNEDLPKAIENLARYKAMMTAKGSGSPRKNQRVAQFMDAMKEETKRRARGEEARPFADPEEDFFGEPPGSPGLEKNAWHTALPLGPGEKDTVTPPTTGSGDGDGGGAAGDVGPAPTVGSLPVMLGVLALLLLIIGSVIFHRRKRE